MARINKILLSKYRNFKDCEISFNNKTNILFGNNGSGKTNILESISLLSKGRGFRNSAILNLIKKNNENFFVNISLEVEDNTYDIKIASSKNNEKYKKILNVNNDSSNESLNFINSSISFLIFLPEMERLFQSSPSYRRNFIDRLIFSEMNTYNRLINKYKKNLIERTKILQQNFNDNTWLNIIEDELSQIGIEIYNLRNTKLKLLNEHIKILNENNNYNFSVNLLTKDNFFKKDLSKDYYISKLKLNREYDKNFGGSKIGPHKSDIIAKINNSFDASQLSTGQQKTVVLMMLIAQCDNLVNGKKIKPILLLDEICSHLDSNNRKIILDIINKFDVQLFLTGTDKTLFSFISKNVKFYNIEKL